MRVVPSLLVWALGEHKRPSGQILPPLSLRSPILTLPDRSRRDAPLPKWRWQDACPKIRFQSSKLACSFPRVAGISLNVRAFRCSFQAGLCLLLMEW
jgi:hypothetical protein